MKASRPTKVLHVKISATFQITQNFDEVVGRLSLVESGVSVYFDHNERVSSHANFCFNGTDFQLPWIIGQLNDCSDLELEKYNITFGE